MNHQPHLSSSRRSLLRALRNLLVLAFALGVMLDRFGLPHALTTYTYDETAGTRRYMTCRYWSVAGARTGTPGQFGEGCPAFVFLPLEKPVTHHVQHWARSLWTRLQSQIP